MESVTSHLSLPPISVNATAASGKMLQTDKKASASNQSSPLKKTDIDQIVEEAKRNRDKKNAISVGEKTKRTTKQFHGRHILPRKKSFRVQAQQVVTTRSLVMGQPIPVSSSEVIDLETSDTQVAAIPKSRSQLYRTDSSDFLLQGQKSHSHSNFSASESEVPDSSTNKVSTVTGERERNRRMITNRVGSVSSSKSLPGATVTKKKKSTQALNRNRAIISQNPAPQDEEWARKTKYWGTTAKPLVKKIAFRQRPDSQISPHPLNSSSGVGDSDTNSMSEKGVTTDNSIADQIPQPARHRSRQKTTLTRQPWKNRRRHGILPHNSQLTKTRYTLPPRKQLPLAKGVCHHLYFLMFLFYKLLLLLQWRQEVNFPNLNHHIKMLFQALIKQVS